MIRTVNYYRLGFALCGWGILVGIIFIAFAWETVENLLFAYEAKATTGTLLARHSIIQHARGGDSARYFFDYKYAADRLRQGTDEVQGETYIQFTENQPLPLRYLASRPGESRVDTSFEAHAHTVNAWEGFGLVSVLTAVGGALFGWQAHRNRIYRSLQTSGVSCVGKVKSFVKTRTGFAYGGTYTSLAFTFSLPSGEVVVGQSDNLGWRKGLWKEGDAIQVFYNPRQPEQIAVDLDHPLSSGA